MCYDQGQLLQMAIAGLSPRNIKMSLDFCNPHILNWIIVYFCGTKGNSTTGGYKGKKNMNDMKLSLGLISL